MKKTQRDARKPAEKKRKQRRGHRKNPAHGQALPPRVKENAMVTFLMGGLRGLISAGYVDMSKATLAKVDCVCEGECLCHTGLQIAGVPCPPDCPNHGKVLDGCHRCDCAQSANAPDHP